MATVQFGTTWAMIGTAPITVSIIAGECELKLVDETTGKTIAGLFPLGGSYPNSITIAAAGQLFGRSGSVASVSTEDYASPFASQIYVGPQGLKGDPGDKGDRGLPGLGGQQGQGGQPGPAGPAPYAAVADWAPFIPYTVGPPASVVSHGDATYVCSTTHISGASFDATKFSKIVVMALNPGGVTVRQLRRALKNAGHFFTVNRKVPVSPGDDPYEAWTSGGTQTSIGDGLYAVVVDAIGAPAANAAYEAALLITF